MSGALHQGRGPAGGERPAVGQARCDLAQEREWVTAETGRQPWVVYGYLRTSQAVSHLAPAELVFSVIGFILIYAAMLAAYITYIVHTMRTGPERDHPDFRPGPHTATSRCRPPAPAPASS